MKIFLQQVFLILLGLLAFSNTLQLHDHHYNRKSLLNESKSRLTNATRFRRHVGAQLALDDLGLPPLDRSHPRFKRGKINKKKPGKIKKKEPHKDVDIKTKSKMVECEEGELGGFVIIIILLIVICCCCWEKKEPKEEKLENTESEYKRAIGQNMEERRKLEEELIGLQNLEEEIRQELIAEKRRKILNNSYEWS